jgi:hypothetical protein
VLLTLGLASSGGCLVTRVKWKEPDYAASQAGLFGSRKGLDHLEQLYATALEHEQQCLESCVDLYFEVALATCQHQGPACSDCRKRLLHKSALNKLVVTGQQFCRLDPRSGLSVHRGGQQTWIPIAHRGFVWQPRDFHRLIPVGKYKTNGLRTLHRRDGVGVPLVVTSCRPKDASFVARRPTFAATLRMNVESCGVGADEQVTGSPLSCRLDLYDPLRSDQTLVQGELRCIAKDLSAPLAYRLRDDPQTILDSFINPGSATGATELRAIEPYQPGKIPVVFIHGLLSNPYTWVEMVNELQAYPGFVEHFQIWVIEYPTGQPFLTSAAECRAQLHTARHTFDPTRADAQLSNIVLVGHSMGGLISKLQVTSSGDRLWRSIANRPFDQVAIPTNIRQKLVDAFFFEPSPDVSRVVYVGTPHRGSGFANRTIGRLGSALVEEPEDLVQAHADLMRCNPGVFSEEVSRRIPTSIDLLEPDSELLNAIAALPARCDVRMHSMIGNSCYTLFSGKSDGVVPVTSARDHRTISERYIKTIHTRLTKNPETVQELLCILQQHLQQSRDTSIGSAVSQSDADIPVAATTLGLPQ